MWHELSDNPKMCEAFFYQSPSLHSIELHSINFDRNGPSAKISFVLPVPPQRIPVKLKNGDFNSVFFEISFFPLCSIELTDWQENMNVSIELSGQKNSIVLVVRKQPEKQPCIRLMARCFRFEKISPYLKQSCK